MRVQAAAEQVGEAVAGRMGIPCGATDGATPPTAPLDRASTTGRRRTSVLLTLCPVAGGGQFTQN